MYRSAENKDIRLLFLLVGLHFKPHFDFGGKIQVITKLHEMAKKLHKIFNLRKKIVRFYDLIFMIVRIVSYFSPISFFFRLPPFGILVSEM